MHRSVALFLKSLTMKGFKSFADTTVLDFEPGVTVVVGPNGSGKSNVVDAIAWVLGAQGPRTVRSQKMDDVVFAGTPQRPALGRADVELVIDNSSGILPVEFTEVTIRRTLFRDGDSEYSLNGVPCRLLDIQELLSDVGVGRQQHIIVAQGQIDQVLNARPEDRRTIIEEAAGILKFRRRKERAERRLDATEANLTRLQDLQREVRRQLRPLERQADAARRHGDLVSEMKALRLHLAGRELESLQRGQEANRATKARLAEEEATVLATLGELDVAIMAAEDRLAASGDNSLDTLPRVESLRERCRGLQALVEERRRAVERDKGAMLAEDVVANLEADRARVQLELDGIETQTDRLDPEGAALGVVEADLDADRASFANDRAETVSNDGALGRAAEIRGELAALRTSVERVDAEDARLAERLTQLETRQRTKEADLELHRSQLGNCQGAEQDLVERADAAEDAVIAAELELQASLAQEVVAGAGLASWQARVDALELAIDDARARSGLERLGDVEGVLGLLAELIEIEAGWEPAVEAAAGDALAAVVVADIEAAREALRCLGDQDASGAVLALRTQDKTTEVPPVGDPLRRRVGARVPEVEPLLDVLLGSAVAVDGGWLEATDAALSHPDLTIVTRAGDRCSPQGWRLGAGGPGATAAALEEARSEVGTSAELVDAVGARVEEATSRAGEVKVHSLAALESLNANDDALTRAGDAIDRVQRELGELRAEMESMTARQAEFELASSRDRQRVVDLQELLPELEAAEKAIKDSTAEMTRVSDALDERSRAVSAQRAELETRAASLLERRGVLLERREELIEKLTDHEREAAQATSRRERVEASLSALDSLTTRLAVHRSGLDTELGQLRERRQQLSAAVREVTDQLDARRRERSDAEKRQSEIRELLGRCEIDEAEQRVRIENLVLAIRQDLDVEPEAALGASVPDLAEGVTPAARARDLDRELQRMGPINPLALQEFEALNERHDFVAGQLDDVRQGRRELTKVIRAVDEEIVRIFAAAFADVSENFTQLFSTLFVGGEGRLKLTDPADLLNTGVELEARPSGKNVRKLSLLSGGERSLTALAFLFAIFRSRPSPFYVMDEVEAALDDMNLHRFLDLIAEFRREAQLVIVSHQKRTMEAAEVLYGVSMPPGGSSRVISERVA